MWEYRNTGSHKIATKHWHQPATATDDVIEVPIADHCFKIMNKIYDSWPTYDGNDLELCIDSNGTHFALWSPEAQSAKVVLYPSGHDSKAKEIVSLAKSSNGVWRASLPERLCGMFYTFQIKYHDNWLEETPGSFAKATGVNGIRAAIIDMESTNPEGWEDDHGPNMESITDAIIYEMHHRDFSIHASSGIVHKGKFLALTEHGTLNNHGALTGIDHLLELGITHVHILPSYDFDSIDETDTESSQYNWGYDPSNFNVPEGSYSTDASNPATRILEMKEMVKSLHNAGIGVIMDVAYSHTSKSDDSNLYLTAPGYYYRHHADGTYSNASGCGNETASERRQMRNLIINSVKFWATEYHIDGFRFDLMAIHDIETMNNVASELRKINPGILLYGEGWTCGESPLPSVNRALKENVASMDRIAVFSDDIRDSIKGHYCDISDRGFVTGKRGCEETIKIGIVAATAHPQVDYRKGNNSKFPYAKSPQEVINYVSCHDDYTLSDKLAFSMKDATVSERKRAARLAQTIVLTSQGVPLISAGEEVFRDKKGVGNSYCSPDSINAIDWDLKTINNGQFEYYRELIALRKAHPAFRMRSAGEIARNIVFDNTGIPNLISYSILNNANDDDWKEIKVVLNGNSEDVSIDIQEYKWTVIACDGKIRATGLGLSNGGKMTAARISALILARE